MFQKIPKNQPLVLDESIIVFWKQDGEEHSGIFTGCEWYERFASRIDLKVRKRAFFVKFRKVVSGEMDLRKGFLIRSDIKNLSFGEVLGLVCGERRWW